MPKNIQQTLKLFSSLNYVLFKCEHILQGSNKNVDLLLSDDDYRQASAILEQNGFVLYMPESIEKYKRMYVRFDCAKQEFILTAIHLHREVAWHGLIALTKNYILARAKNNFPSAEDSLLIHSAHALFENFRVSDFHQDLLEKYKCKATEHNYIKTQLREQGWEKEFRRFIRTYSVPKKNILSIYLKNFWVHPGGAHLFFRKAVTALCKKISIRRRGYLIALIGMNGTGKTTLQRQILEQYQPLTKFVSGQLGYYFGWKPTFFSRAVAKTTGDTNIFQKVTPEKIKRFDLFQEVLFVYIYGTYLRRYYRDIYPQLRKNYLVLSDRYFYDLYGQYPYSKNSIILPLLPIPKPNALFILDADVDTAMKRDKTGKEERRVQPAEKLAGQKQRYLDVARQRDGAVLNTQQEIEKNIQQIISATWRGFVRP